MFRLIKRLGYKEVSDFYKDISDEKLDPNEVIEKYVEERDRELKLDAPKEAKSAETFQFENPDEEILKGNDDVLVIDQNLKGIDFQLAQCCHPIYGDPVFGFVTVSGGIKIHRKDCPNAPELRKRFGYRIVKARWSGKGVSKYAITLRIIGNDDIGIVSNITNVIAKEETLTMRSINIDSHDGLFSGNVVVLIDDASKSQQLIKKLRTIKGVKQVTRL
jgi:GTP pyrophosphokinase